MICNSWPRVVFLRGNEEDCTNTLLMDLTYDCSYSNNIERLRNVSRVFFEAAEKTKEGVRGLVSASDAINVGVQDYF
jgi:hypothetical protein